MPLIQSLTTPHGHGYGTRTWRVIALAPAIIRIAPHTPPPNPRFHPNSSSNPINLRDRPVVAPSSYPPFPPLPRSPPPAPKPIHPPHPLPPAQVIHSWAVQGSTKIERTFNSDRVVGNGSFGIVFMATCIETDEKVAIKKVLQDRRFKNRELDVMRMVSHPNIVQLMHCFFTYDKEDMYLNLVLEYVPDTVYRLCKQYAKRAQRMPVDEVRVYVYQICRALHSIHDLGVCHRDIKPQNLLVNSETHELKLCDFGSAKQLRQGEPNISYICSRYASSQWRSTDRPTDRPTGQQGQKGCRPQPRSSRTHVLPRPAHVPPTTSPPAPRLRAPHPQSIPPPHPVPGSLTLQVLPCA